MTNATLESLRDPRPSKDDRRILNFQFQGYIITMGKNSFSNERLVSQHPHRDCLWFHAMSARGSHVILCVHGRQEPSEEVLNHAAGLALKHSHSEARTVSVSLLRDLFKPEHAGVGIWKTSKFLSMEVAE